MVPRFGVSPAAVFLYRKNDYFCAKLKPDKMEKLLDKFLRYVSVETTSDENSESQPSTAKQLKAM